MTDTPAPAPDTVDQRGPSALLLTLLATATGALIANLYYAQPLVAAIAPDIQIGREVAGSIVSIIQIAYGLGLFLLVPLADRFENKRLVLATLALTTLGLIGMALATSITPFFIAAF